MSKLMFSDEEQNNADAESVELAEQTAESGVRVIESAHRSREKTKRDNAESEEPSGQRQQKKNLKREYATKVRQTEAEAATETAEDAKETATKTVRKVRRYVEKHKKSYLIVGGIVLLIAFLLNAMTSVITVFPVEAATALATYPVADEDIYAAEAAYLAMEKELREYLDDYEDDHDYDEYSYDLDDIEHDPYVLISAITALYGGEWKIGDVGGGLETLFDKQYILTETVTTETRYRTETRTGRRPKRDRETGEFLYDEDDEFVWEEYDYEVQIPYTYYKCRVELENFNLSHVPVYVMSESQLSVYSMYLSVLGNRPDLFPGSEYAARYNGGYTLYEVPPEALKDEVFAAMLAEAEKYLGYPYVWGGSSPSTSFDCSGFVCWVINNCGVGWSIGRLGSDALYFNVCTPVSAANARPGDLVFFCGTYDTPYTSHVGIYVGDGWMIHCGSPIQYANLNSSYWQSHLYGYGRLPAV